MNIGKQYGLSNSYFVKSFLFRNHGQSCVCNFVLNGQNHIIKFLVTCRFLSEYHIRILRQINTMRKYSLAYRTSEHNRYNCKCYTNKPDVFRIHNYCNLQMQI